MNQPRTTRDVVAHPSGTAATAPAEAPQDRHDREVRESRREERRLLAREVACLVLVVGFVIVRQLWLV